MTTFGKRFREAREEAGLSQKSIAELFDPPLSRNAVAIWESGGMPDADKLPTLARAVRRSVDYLLTGRGRSKVAETDGTYNLTPGPEMSARVPIISWVQAGTWASIVDNFHPGDADEWAPTSVPVHRHTYALRVRGDSMTNPAGGEPTFPDGQVIVVEPDAIDAPEKLVGSFVIVKRSADEEATFKQLVKDAGRFYLKPLNPRYPMLELKEGDVFCGVVREKVVRFF